MPKRIFNRFLLGIFFYVKQGVHYLTLTYLSTLSSSEIWFCSFDVKEPSPLYSIELLKEGKKRVPGFKY